MVVGKDGKAVVVRFPREMLARLTSAAMRSGRSRNSEIVQRLHQSLSRNRNK